MSIRGKRIRGNREVSEREGVIKGGKINGRYTNIHYLPTYLHNYLFIYRPLRLLCVCDVRRKNIITFIINFCFKHWLAAILGQYPERFEFSAYFP